MLYENTMSNLKKKIFLLADSAVDLRFICELLKKNYCVKWVFYNKKLYDDLYKLGYQEKDFIFIRNYNLLSVIKRVLTKIFGILNFNFEKELTDNIKNIDTILKPDLWITDTGNILSKVETKAPRATFKHSIPYKKFFLAKNIFNYDYVFIPGDYHFNRIINFYKHREQELKKKLIISISPKILSYIKLKNKFLDKKNFCKKYHLDYNKQIVVLATTHNSFADNRFLPKNFGSEIISLKKICEILTLENKFNFIIKLHHYHYNKILNANYNFLKEFKNVCVFKANKNFDSLDSEEVFINSDIVITDTSGVGPLCCYLDKKMIYLDPDPPFDWETSDIEKYMRPGFIMNKINELSYVLKCYIDMPTKFAKERKKFTKTIFKYTSEEHLRIIERNIEKLLNEKNIL